MTQPDASQSPRTIYVAAVDDSSDFLLDVKEALNGTESCFKVVGWTSPEDFENDTLASAPYDLLVFDEFFGKGSHDDPRAGELIEHSRKHLPWARPIVLSTNKFKVVSTKTHRFKEVPFVGKDVFWETRGSALRSAVREQLPKCPKIDERTHGAALWLLLQKDKEAEVRGLELSHHKLAQFSMGDSTSSILYPFTRQFEEKREWAEDDAECKFELADYPGFMTGFGPDTNSARHAFYAHFHMNFQRLQCIRKVNLIGDDKKLWAVFTEIVDMNQYRHNRTVIVSNLIGKVESVDGQGTCEVRWCNCQPSTHSLDKAPCLANLREGDWIEGVVEQQLLAQLIVRVIDASRIEAPIYSQEQRERFWNQTETEGAE